MLLEIGGFAQERGAGGGGARGSQPSVHDSARDASHETVHRAPAEGPSGPLRRDGERGVLD